MSTRGLYIDVTLQNILKYNKSVTLKETLIIKSTQRQSTKPTRLLESNCMDIYCIFHSILRFFFLYVELDGFPLRTKKK